jgi:hypothetical protein
MPFDRRLDRPTRYASAACQQARCRDDRNEPDDRRADRHRQLEDGGPPAEKGGGATRERVAEVWRGADRGVRRMVEHSKE